MAELMTTSAFISLLGKMRLADLRVISASIRRDQGSRIDDEMLAAQCSSRLVSAYRETLAAAQKGESHERP